MKNEVENLEDYQWQKHLTIAKYSMALVSTDSVMPSSFQLRIGLNQVNFKQHQINLNMYTEFIFDSL